MKNTEHREIDNTRARLKLNKLEANTRKDLFDKFVNAGGEVITPYKNNIKKHAPIISKDKTRNNLSKSKPESNTNKKQNNKSRYRADNIQKEVKKNSLFTNLSLWFDAYSAGLISFSGGKVNPKFLNFIDKTVTTALLEMDNYIFAALNPYADNKIEASEKKTQVLSVFEKEPENLEILERIKNQYNERSYKSFLRPFKELNSPVVASSYINELRDMFKPLYILKLYTDRMKVAGEKALMKYAIIDNMSKDLLATRILNFKKDVDIVYNKYYNKLLILLQYASKERLELNDNCMRFLNITEKDILGYYNKLKKEENEEKEKQIEIEKANEIKNKKNNEENDKLTKIENIGIKLIDKIVSFQKQNNNINYETDPFYHVDELDKVYRIKVLLDFLYVEYSILFVTNKVKYNSIYDNNERKDYKESFNNIFLSLSDLDSRFHEYSSVCNNISKIEEDPTIKHEHKVSILAEKNSERSYLAKNIKSNVIELITTLKNMLDKLLLDKEEREKIISNPTDIITLTEISGNSKRIQGYDVMKALTEAYYFISGIYKLITRGELYGNGLLVELPNTKAAEKITNIIKE